MNNIQTSGLFCVLGWALACQLTILGADLSQDHYGTNMSAEESLARMAPADGFRVDLIAAEPRITQPIAMCFDAKGRIWVLEGHTYPVRAAEGQGRDRIVILEDSDHDGSYETKKTFIEKINLGSGLEVGFGGVWVGAAPYFMFIPDADGDDQPDSEPQILLDGWGYQDTHETLNSFTWGPDGWLYGVHGVFTHSRVGKPGTPDHERTPLNAGVWRYHPTRHEFEVFAQGTSNPWGLDFNEKGDFFISACVIPHFFHMVQGGRYIRQGGTHFNPYTYGEINTIADHKHYAGAIQDHAFWGENRAARPPAPVSTSELGGGHAHCGLMIYQADVFPEQYRGEAFFHNLHGHRILQEHLEPNGSGFIAQHRPDFLFANSHDFIGVGIMQGPDGAIYFSDWVDPQTCHHRDENIWDRSNGRVFRARYGAVRPSAIALRSETTVQLVERLSSPNAFIARQAQLVLQERAASGQTNRRELKPLLDAFKQNHRQDANLLLRAFWTAHVTGINTLGDLRTALNHSNEHIRAWALQFLGERQEQLDNGTLSKINALAAKESSPVTRRYLASLLQRLPLEQRWGLAARLLNDRSARSDHNIPLLVWYGIEPLVEANPERITNLVNSAKWEQLQGYVSRRAAATPQGRTRLLTQLANAADADTFARDGKQLLTALRFVPQIEQPEGWQQARRKGESFARQSAAVQDVLNQLGVRFGDADFYPHWRQVALNRNTDNRKRNEALQLLQNSGDPELGSIGRELLTQPRLRSEAIRALRTDPGLLTAQALIEQLSSLNQQQRNDAINLLASRADMASALLRAVDAGAIPASTISPILLDQFEAFGDDEISQLIERNWSRGSSELNPAELASTLNAWRQRLNWDALSRADASRGRAVYQNVCGNCHTLYGEGIAVGPDLTGSNRADISYLLENVLAPSAIVGTDYVVHVLKLTDDTVISGMIKEETTNNIKLTLAGGTETDVNKASVVSRERTKLSLMPSGLFEAMEFEQVADLVKYLTSSTQVALPTAGQ